MRGQGRRGKGGWWKRKGGGKGGEEEGKEGSRGREKGREERMRERKESKRGGGEGKRKRREGWARKEEGGEERGEEERGSGVGFNTDVQSIQPYNKPLLVNHTAEVSMLVTTYLLQPDTSCLLNISDPYTR